MVEPAMLRHVAETSMDMTLPGALVSMDQAQDAGRTLVALQPETLNSNADKLRQVKFNFLQISESGEKSAEELPVVKVGNNKLARKFKGESNDCTILRHHQFQVKEIRHF